MRRHILAAALAVLLTQPAGAIVGIFVPYFSGPKALGQNVSTSIYFQIWRTFRRAPFPNPRNVAFGSAIARYATQPVDTGASSPEAIAGALEREAKWAETQMVLWGNVRELGDGVVVQAFLAAPVSMSRSDQFDQWTLTEGPNAVILDLPRRLFDFDPVVMGRELISVYSSPDAMRMCARKALPCDDMPLSDDWVADRQEPGGWALVTSRRTSRQGWLYLPSAERLPNGISNFASALVSYYRGDWSQAARLFDVVAKRADAQSAIRADAAVLAAIARARSGATNQTEFDALLEADPYSLYALKAAITAGLSAALTMRDPNPGIRRLAARVDANRQLFSGDDAWLQGFDRLVQARASH